VKPDKREFAVQRGKCITFFSTSPAALDYHRAVLGSVMLIHCAIGWKNFF